MFDLGMRADIQVGAQGARFKLERLHREMGEMKNRLRRDSIIQGRQMLQYIENIL